MQQLGSAIGGFLELERPFVRRNAFSHNAVNSGRSGLELILRHYRPVKLWIPFFICNCVPEFLSAIEQPYERYHVNAKLELEQQIDLKPGEMLLYVNYFGIKDNYCNTLQEQYGQSLILDLTQAFFYQKKAKCPSFSSMRKFFGVPDGGVVTGVTSEEINLLQVATAAEYASHLLYRADGQLAEGYRIFKYNERRFGNEHPLRMSNLSHIILQSVDFTMANEVRRRNFARLNQRLKSQNRIELSSNSMASLSYPFWVDNGELIRKMLIESNIFIPQYWPDLNQLNKNEQSMVENTIHLPIDQRYEIVDMDKILDKLENEIYKTH